MLQDATWPHAAVVPQSSVYSADIYLSEAVAVAVAAEDAGAEQYSAAAAAAAVAAAAAAEGSSTWFQVPRVDTYLPETQNQSRKGGSYPSSCGLEKKQERTLAQERDRPAAGQQSCVMKRSKSIPAVMRVPP